MPYYSREEIEKAREMDLLTYLQNFEPSELVHVTGNTWSVRDHDSLKISNGKWMWWSRGFGGASALDYLVKVRGDPFTKAVEKILGQAAAEPSFLTAKAKQEDRPKKLLLPEHAAGNERVRTYLAARGIDLRIVDACIERGLLYESLPYHNAVFVGFDMEGTARYACYRAASREKIMGDAAGSDKRYSFRIIGAGGQDTVHIFESAIDLLSYATLRMRCGQDWQAEAMLSLGGVYAPQSKEGSWKMPAALRNLLENAPEISTIAMHLDNDYAGRAASERLKQMLEGQYRVRDEPPAFGKDVNEELNLRLRRRAEIMKERDRDGR